ncbi:MAG: elongator complex protein 3 [bacterium]
MKVDEKRRKIIPIFIESKGCPQRCVYCNQREVACATEIDTESAIRRYSETVPPSCEIEVAFYGGNFTGLSRQEQIERLRPAKRALDEGRIQGIRISTRPDYIDRRTAADLAEYGVSTVELGAQSMVDDVLEEIERGHTAQDVADAVKLLKEHGIRVSLHLMLGLPKSSPAQDIFSLEEAIKLGPDFMRVHPTLVIKDTDLSRDYLEGRYTPLTMQETIPLCKYVVLRLEQARIPLIRLGLFPSVDLQRDGVVVAGPYHPSLRFIVDSKIFYDRMNRSVNSANSSEVTLYVNPHDLPKAYGYRRENLDEFARRGIKVNLVASESVERGKVRTEL